MFRDHKPICLSTNDSTQIQPTGAKMASESSAVARGFLFYGAYWSDSLTNLVFTVTRHAQNRSFFHLSEAYLATLRQNIQRCSCYF